MKKILVVLTTLLFSTLVYPQIHSKDGMLVVKVKDWNKKLFMIHDTYWDNDAKEIISKIGEDEYNKVKVYSDYKTIPDQMSLMVNGTKANIPVLYKNLDRLKMYKIATYRHINEEKEDRGVWAIIKVPYDENKEWDSKVKWEHLYFIIPDELVEVK
jgi:hypothetical protein